MASLPLTDIGILIWFLKSSFLFSFHISIRLAASLDFRFSWDLCLRFLYIRKLNIGTFAFLNSSFLLWVCQNKPFSILRFFQFFPELYMMCLCHLLIMNTLSFCVACVFYHNCLRIFIIIQKTEILIKMIIDIYRNIYYPLRATILLTFSILDFLGDHFRFLWDNKKQFSIVICFFFSSFKKLFFIFDPIFEFILLHFFVKSLEFLFEKILFFKLCIIPFEGEIRWLEKPVCGEFKLEISMDRLRVLLGDFE